MDQLSDRKKWLLGRLSGIGSSDAACLYGVGYKTELELYNEKISSEIKEEPSNFAMERGNEFEPIARKLFAGLYNISNFSDERFNPVNMRMDELTFMMSSIDGASNDRKTIIEIKYQGLDAYNNVKDASLPIRDGRIPEKYWIQIQHQLLVSGAHECYFVSYNPEHPDTVNTVAVRPDVEFLKEHIRVCTKFWERVMKKTPPGASEDDYLPLNLGKTLEAKYLAALKRREELDTKIEEMKEQILALVTHPKMVTNDLIIRQETRAGSIRYKDIPAIKEMSEDELNKYRGKDSVFYKISAKPK